MPSRTGQASRCGRLGASGAQKAAQVGGIVGRRGPAGVDERGSLGPEHVDDAGVVDTSLPCIRRSARPAIALSGEAIARLVPQAEPQAGTPMINARIGTLVSRKHCPGRERLAGHTRDDQTADGRALTRDC